MVSGVGHGALPATEAVLARALAARAFPGAVVAAARRGQALRLIAVGRLTYAAGSSEVGPGTLYDLASLTKIVATTTVAMRLHERGQLDLQRPLHAWMPELRDAPCASTTAWQLLTHSSGLPGWAPFFRELSGWDAYFERIAALAPGYPPGTQSVYSDLGFILLGAALERIAGLPWQELVTREALGPLRLQDTCYAPPDALRARIAPTEECAWRRRLVHGEVHDENAFAMGGRAPHAGLFGSVLDVARFAQTMLDGGECEGQRVLSAGTIAAFAERAGIPDSTRALGFDTPSDSGYSAAGRRLSRRAFGHTGFTGTSLWVDPEQGLFVVLLANRVHPTRRNESIRWVRPQVADAVVTDLGLA